MERFPDCLPKDSWFREWMTVWPTSESPKSFLLFSAMAMLGGCLGRRVWMDQDIHQVRPMLNVLLIGPSGIGKSSAVKVARFLLKYIPEFQRPQFIEGGSTKEKLHTDLAENPKAILFAPELAAFFSKEKYKENLIPYVTNLLDYEESIEVRTRRDGVVTVLNPAVSIIGASTLEWLQDQLPDSAVSGGFLARFLILNEDAKGQRIANPQRLLSQSQRAKLDDRRARILAEFGELVHSCPEGNMDYADYEAAETYANWYNSYQPASGYLAPFAARGGEMILRMALLIAVSCRKREIEAEHVSAAIELYTYLAARLDRIVVSTNQQGRLAALIIETVKGPGLTVNQICRKLRSVATSMETERFLESLLYSGDLIAEGDLIKVSP